MKKRVAAVLILISLFFDAFVFGQNGVVYKSATEFDYPPFSVTDQGVADGFSVELLKAVAEEMDLQISFKVDQWDVIKNELKDGKLDVLPIVGHTAERDAYFDFTFPYMVMHGNIFVRKGDDSIRSQEDLWGKEVLVMQGDNAEEYAQTNHLTDHLISVKTYKEAFELLSSGKHDAVVAQSIVGLKLISDLGIENVRAVTAIPEDGKMPTTVSLRDFEQKFCFAVKEGDKDLLEKLNEGLAIIAVNGRYEEIYKKWFPFLIDEAQSFRRLILYAVTAVLVTGVLFLVLSLVFIRREVKRKTLELEKANVALMAARVVAEEANNAKSQFLANMSHEIRTPLNGLMGMLQLLDMTSLSDQQGELVQIAKESSDSLLRVINDILDYSKIEAGMMQLENGPCDVAAVVGDVVKLFKPSAEKKGLSLNYSIEESLPVQLKGDAFRLRQVLSNLIGNAIKFTHKGSVDLSVRQIQTDSPREASLEFTISDTGMGIPNDKLELLFKSFSQADESNTRKYGGTGLGLAISQGIVEAMKGRIWVENLAEGGSAFKFTCVFESAAEAVKADGYNQYVGNQQSTLGARILVAEDDPVSGLLMKQLAEYYGWQIVLVKNGRAAVEAFKSKAFDLLFMDIQMPVMDGFEATAVIRNMMALQGKRTPIIAMTAFALKGDKERCLAAGMDDYLAKPIDLESIREMVDKWIEKERNL